MAKHLEIEHQENEVILCAHQILILLFLLLSYPSTILHHHKLQSEVIIRMMKYNIFSFIIFKSNLMDRNSGPVLKHADEQELGLLKKEKEPASKPKNRAQDIGDQIIRYIRNGFWVLVAAAVIYYSNFFHNLFKNPNINEFFFQISATGYTIVISLMLFTSFIMPRISGIHDVEEYNPKLISIGAVVGLISVISIIIAIWPVWGWWSLAIFICLWKGFFGLSVFLPSGDIGNVLFILLNTGTILSFYIIEHEGYLH